MNFYLHRFGLFNALLQEKVPENIFLSVVIPCYNENSLLNCLMSLKNCYQTRFGVEVIIIVNHAENAPQEIIQQNQDTLSSVQLWLESAQGEKMKFYPLLLSLPKKDAGVGLARKAGMDEAVRRFEKAGIKNGVIVCLDADCTVSPNYLSEIENYFLTHEKCNAASIYFEHPLDSVSGLNRDSITEYEIFLRYYVNGLRFTGHPFAFHTIGSSMAVRNEAYQKQGGMNKRKAGEDFYFLQKIFLLGNFGEISNCTVYPSCRSSDRVPFGTGKAVGDALAGKPIMFYNPIVFYQLKSLIDEILLYDSTSESMISFAEKLPLEMKCFLESVDWSGKRVEIASNVSNPQQFIKRFFSWFDGFMALKAVHYLSDNFFPRLTLSHLDVEPLFPCMKAKDAVNLLHELRKLDRKF